MRILIATVVAALAIGLTACSSTSSSSPSPSPTPCPTGATDLCVTQACQRITYDPGATGQGTYQLPTGWSCKKSDGTLVAFTVQNMQSACDHDHPGTVVRNLAGTGIVAAKNNSQWQCLPRSQLGDGQNPGPACGATGQIKSKYVLTVSTRTVKLPNGRVFGQLLLRHSTICQTAWGEVFYNDAHKPLGFSITVIVIRPHGPHPKTIPFTTTDYVSPAFSSMLANNQAANGCVYAKARVTVGGKTGPTAITACSASLSATQQLQAPAAPSTMTAQPGTSS